MGVFKSLISCGLVLSFLGCGRRCETHGGEKFAVCMRCFPRSTVVVCIPCVETDKVEHCKPYCDECGSRNIVKMTQWEMIERRKKLGYE